MIAGGLIFVVRSGGWWLPTNRFPRGVTADNLRDSKRVAVAAFGGKLVPLLTDNFLLDIHYDRHGSPPQHEATARITAAL
jgi:hypothetical protein